MDENVRKKLTVVACACFASHALTQLIDAIKYRALLGQLPNLAVYILLLIGLMQLNSIFLSVGGGLALVMSIFGAIINVGNYGVLHNKVVIITGLLSVLVGLFLLLMGLKRRSSILCGYVAATISSISVLMASFGWRVLGPDEPQQPIRVFRIVLSFLWIVGVVITGYLRREMPTITETWQQFKHTDE